jgi:hypothetical protein
MRLVLDSGALIALERNSRSMWTLFKLAQGSGIPMVTHGGVVGQAWRGKGPRQALLARALAGTDVRPLDDGLGRAAGELLARGRSRDVIDAALVVLARDGDRIVTSDLEDLEPLVTAAELDIEVVRP